MLKIPSSEVNSVGIKSVFSFRIGVKATSISSSTSGLDSVAWAVARESIQQCNFCKKYKASKFNFSYVYLQLRWGAHFPFECGIEYDDESSTASNNHRLFFGWLKI